MIYEIRHVTTYDYRVAVPLARCLLRLTPVDRPGQSVLATRLEIEPVRHDRQDAVDFFGNHVTRIAIRRPHRTMVITATARVEVDDARDRAAGTSPAWEPVRAIAAVDRRLDAGAPLHCLFASRLVPLLPEATDYASASFAPGRPILEAATELAARIKADFDYDPEATEVSTPLATAMAKRHGVCQDFAHVMISGLRGLGLPAAYVSGYLVTEPPPGQERLEGADAMHAWVSVWCGPELGWIGLDPTNAIAAGPSHIVVALGRDYADVSPIDGVVLTSGSHSMRSAVDVRPVDADAEPAPAAAGPRAGLSLVSAQ